MLLTINFAESLKRCFDVIGAVTGLIALWPLMAIGAFGIWMENGNPVFFTQARIGRNGKIFKIFKIRTMTESAAPDIEAVATDHMRVLRVGRILRKTSVDELPQLLNVLRGDMSLVGPRPLLVDYLPLYNQQQSRRHEVRPGLTGWAQINGRADLNWNDRFLLDVWYVDNRSFLVDLKIVWLTVKTFGRNRGSNEINEDRLPPFSGQEK